MTGNRSPGTVIVAHCLNANRRTPTLQTPIKMRQYSSSFSMVGHNNYRDVLPDAESRTNIDAYTRGVLAADARQHVH